MNAILGAKEGYPSIREMIVTESCCKSDRQHGFSSSWQGSLNGRILFE
jgi:hypothetical protein